MKPRRSPPRHQEEPGESVRRREIAKTLRARGVLVNESRILALLKGDYTNEFLGIKMLLNFGQINFDTLTKSPVRGPAQYFNETMTVKLRAKKDSTVSGILEQLEALAAEARRAVEGKNIENLRKAVDEALRILSTIEVPVA